MADPYCSIWCSGCHDPAVNLAFEESLMEMCDRNQVILYLWQNNPSLIIGRHQNPYVECHVPRVIDDRIPVIRRKSGGGTVYHDLGNLNYTFIAGKDYYDEKRHFRVIMDALVSLGIKAELTDRNDLRYCGKKFSGNAFIHHKTVSCHHGTLLVSGDLDKLVYYLEPSKITVDSKGVPSIRTKVVNLNQALKGLKIEALEKAIVGSFEKEYNCQCTKRVMETSQVDASNVECYKQWHWNVGESPKAVVSLEDHLDHMGPSVSFQIKNGLVTYVSNKRETPLSVDEETLNTKYSESLFRRSEL